MCIPSLGPSNLFDFQIRHIILIFRCCTSVANGLSAVLTITTHEIGHSKVSKCWSIDWVLLLKTVKKQWHLIVVRNEGCLWKLETKKFFVTVCLLPVFLISHWSEGHPLGCKSQTDYPKCPQLKMIFFSWKVGCVWKILREWLQTLQVICVTVPSLSHRKCNWKQRTCFVSQISNQLKIWLDGVYELFFSTMHVCQRDFWMYRSASILSFF